MGKLIHIHTDCKYACPLCSQKNCATGGRAKPVFCVLCGSEMILSPLAFDLHLFLRGDASFAFVSEKLVPVSMVGKDVAVTHQASITCC